MELVDSNPLITDYHLDSEGESDGTWFISYGDVVTLLLCFFILFFSLNPKHDDALRVEKALLGALQAQGLKVEGSMGSAQITGADKADKPKVQVGQKKEDGADAQVVQKWDGVAQKIGEEIIVAFPFITFFPSGHTELTREGEEALTRFIKVYEPYVGRHKLRVQAYTDLRPVKFKKHRSFQTNLELSVLRSLSAMKALIKQGVPIDRIRLAGFGELKLSQEQILGIPKEKRHPTANLDYARKIVISIQPDMEGGL